MVKKSGISSWSKNDYFKELQKTGACLVIAEREQSEVAGFAHSRLITSRNEKQPGSPSGLLLPIEVEILNIFVNTKYRRNSVGKNLLNQCINHFLTGNETLVHLEVRESNTDAIRFYCSEGFEISGVRKNYYSNPRENAILMRSRRSSTNSLSDT
jgi:ribosomal-protein-alanine N-acetyltransferase